MGSIADAIEQVVKMVLSNLDSLTVHKINTRSRHDLHIANGAGASIVLRGDKVFISGLMSSDGKPLGENDFVVDRLYFGSDLLCWIERNPKNGNLTFHAAPECSVEFERG